MPERVGPHVKLVFAEMARLRVTYDELEESSSVRRPSVKAWRRKNRPGLESLEAVLNSLGWSLTPTPALEILPAEIAADMAALATKMKLGIPETWAALLDWMARQHNQCITADQRLAEITRRREAEFVRRREAAANDNRPRRRVAKAAASAT
jgi:hypothetical protein